MSAPQMICHLSDAFLMMSGDKTVSESADRVPRVVIKWIALYLPVRWPPEIQTRPELDQLVGGRCPGDFAADVADVESWIERMAKRPVRGPWPSHPVFGSMSGRNWMRWAYLHVDHHLRQFGA